MDARVLYPRPLVCKSTPRVIHAELTGSDTASASGITVRGGNPVLKLCRELIEAGHDPGTPLEAWRGGTLCLSVRSIGEAASLALNGKGTGFIRLPAVCRGLPVERAAKADPEQGGMTP